MAYINAMAVVSEYVATNWTATPVQYVNAPAPSIPQTGTYAGFYIKVYGASTTVESELSASKRKVDQGIIRVDIMTPDGSAYIKSGTLAGLLAGLLDNEYFNGVQLGTAAINPNAGYDDNGMHVTRIELDYVTDYEYS